MGRGQNADIVIRRVDQLRKSVIRCWSCRHFTSIADRKEEQS